MPGVVGNGLVFPERIFLTQISAFAEIQRLKDHMRGAVPVRRLELVTDVTIRC